MSLVVSTTAGGVRKRTRPDYGGAYARSMRYRQWRPRLPRVTGGASRRYGRNPFLRNIRTGGLFAIEHKFIDHIINFAIPAPTDATGGEMFPDGGAINTFTSAAQGDGASNRDGNKIVVTDIVLKGNIVCDAQNTQTTADVAPTIIIAMVQDTQTNGVAMVSEQVFTNPTASALAASQPFRNVSHMSRYKILAIKVFTLDMTPMGYLSAANFCQAGKHYPVYMTWKGRMPVTFTTGSTTDDVANVTDNNVAFITYCSNVSLVPTFRGTCRTRFYG